MKLHEMTGPSKRQFMTDPSEIAEWMEWQNIQNYVINANGSVDVVMPNDEQCLFQSNESGKYIKFGTVDGNFAVDCDLGGDWLGLPLRITRNFDILDDANLTSLEGISDVVKSVGEWIFIADASKIERNVLGLMLIEGTAYLTVMNDNRRWSDIVGKYMGKPDMIFQCQFELIEAGLEAFAQL